MNAASIFIVSKPHYWLLPHASWRREHSGGRGSATSAFLGILALVFSATE